MIHSVNYKVLVHAGRLESTKEALELLEVLAKSNSGFFKAVLHGTTCNVDFLGNNIARKI